MNPWVEMGDDEVKKERASKRVWMAGAELGGEAVDNSLQRTKA